MESSRARKGKDASDSPIGGAQCKPHQYDVFINHRGPDVKKTFVAHLDDALRRDGYKPFLDAKDIGKGRHVFKSIDKALKGACVHIVIFSDRYAESKYSLNELCDILKSKQVILPVFYHVNAEDLRWIENGPFKEGFEKHMKRGRIKEVEKWKEALHKVADYRGFRLDEVNGDEMQLIRSILVKVRSAMPTTLLPAKQCYGMEESMRDVLKTLESVSALGLVGMGGIGKTTLATEIYNHFVSRRQFDRYCFLKDVRSSEPSQLQHDLLKDLGHGSELQSMRPPDYKRAFDALISQRVLVVVDDIDDLRQFESLIPDIQKFGTGSRIVITSRQQDVVIRAMAAAPSQEVYDVPCLKKYDSWHLFNRHAFLSKTPSDGFAELAAKLGDACDDLPLLLETIGASLLGVKDREVWLDAMKSVEENKEIFGKLRSTYDRLPTDGDRVMFQDIACLFIGMQKEVALRIWKSCGSCSRAHCSTSKAPALALRRLMDRSLVKVDDFGRLRMHDVLRDMGREFVKEEACGSKEWTHLWDPASAVKALGYKKMNFSTRGMSLAVWEGYLRMVPLKILRRRLFLPRMGKPKDGAVFCNASQLTSMMELHFLILDGCDVIVHHGFSSWPRELRWLQWRECCFASLPSHLNFPNLLPLLEMLDLSWCVGLEELAENVGKRVPKLKSLVMNWCRKLWKLPDSIGQLTGIEHLNLSDCRELVSLPDVIVRLVSLRTLRLSSCSKLQQLPEELGKLTNLETLDVSWCMTLSKLPGSVGGLRMLKTLDMDGTGVKDLPMEFGVLTSLASLSMEGLHSVPETFQGLRALTSLRVQIVSGDLGDLGALADLKRIYLLSHEMITSLPKSLGNLKRLVSLVMNKCPELLIVEALPEGLEELDLSECSKLSEIPSLAAVRCLVKLRLKNCNSLKHVHGLECITTLKEINVSGCTSIEDCRINGMVNNALCECDVSGSRVGVAYNNRWLERDPAVQAISWLGGAILPLSNGMAKELLLSKGRWRLVLEATISSRAECIALIWCLYLINTSGMDGEIFAKVEVWRGGQVVVESTLFFGNVMYLDSHNKVCLYTLRREHHLVQSLQLGDQICVYLQTLDEGVTVVEGGVCVVYNEDEKLVLAMNSEELSMNESEDLGEQFRQLVLKDKCGYDDAHEYEHETFDVKN